MHDCLEEQIESKQFTPDWDNAPKNANFITIDEDGMMAWHELEPNIDGGMGVWGSDGENGVLFCTKLQVFERPKPPTPSVEVGQVWKGRIFWATKAITALTLTIKK